MSLGSTARLLALNLDSLTKRAHGAAFTLLTTEPGPDVAPIHERQIVILNRDDWSCWLDLTWPAAQLLQPPCLNFAAPQHVCPYAQHNVLCCVVRGPMLPPGAQKIWPQKLERPACFRPQWGMLKSRRDLGI